MIKIRILTFFFIALPVILFLPYWYFIVGALFYALVLHTPYELLVLAVLVDVQFGEIGHTIWCVYTLGTVCVLGLSCTIKPYLRFYENP